MSIKLELYRVFQEVADRGSVSGAAKTLYISQSAVSQSIRQLEQQLGVRLFTRNARGVTLTGAGDGLYRSVSTALGLLESGEQALLMTRSLEKGRLTIGASDTITLCFLLPILDAFHRAYPGVGLRVLNGTSLEVIELLGAGRADLAFANLPIADRRVQSRRCFDIQDVFVASADYPLDFDQTYSMEQIAAMPLILLEKKSNSRLFVEQCFLRQGVTLAPEIELGSYDMMLALTRIGLGVSCVIREFSQPMLTEGVLRELYTSSPLPPRSIGAFTLKNVAVSPASQRFLEMAGCWQVEKEE